MILGSYFGINGKAQNLKSINLDAKLLGLLAASDGGLRQVADLPPVQKGSLAVLAGGKLPTASTASRHIKGHEFLNNFI